MSGAKRKTRLLVAFFSYSGNTRQVAQRLFKRLQISFEVEIVEIVPKRKRCYLHWLAYSFLPGSVVEVQNSPLEVSSYDAVVLAFPKWTFSCPPLNKFIRILKGCEVPRFFLIMTYGGFDEDRFLRSFTGTLEGMGCHVDASVKLKRNRISKGDFVTAVNDFASRIEAHLLGRMTM